MFSVGFVLYQAETYQIFYKNLTGVLATVNIHSNNSVDNLKGQIQPIEGIQPMNQRLIFDGKQLEDGKKLSDYNIQKGANIHLVIRVRVYVVVYGLFNFLTLILFYLRCFDFMAVERVMAKSEKLTTRTLKSVKLKLN